MLRIGIAALALAAMTLLLAFTSASLAAQAGCGGKPGSPDHAALLQYCPEHDRAAGSGGGATVAGAEPTSTPSSAPQHAKADKTASHPQIPLTNYPSSDGINLLLVLLVVVATGSGVAYGARRWRRSRPQTS